MARKSQTITITTDGRDKGRTFEITEMPADQAERWAIRAVLAIGRSGVALPDGALDSGMAGLAVIGLQALMKIDFNDARPLLDEMFECVQYKPPTRGLPLQKIIEGEGSQIEEVRTRYELRLAVLRIHTDFFSAEKPLSSVAQPVPAIA